MKKKLIIILLVLLAIFGGVYLVSFSRAGNSDFKLETVKRGAMHSFVSASGEIKAERDASLKFQASGLLSWVGVKKGETVKKGQALASLDTRELKKKLEKEMNDYLSERWDFEQTQDDYQETKERKLITDEIQRILDKTQYALNNSVLDYELANLSYRLATIYSPFEGIVVELGEPYPGVNILSTATQARVVDPTSLYFEAMVDETDVAKIKVGDEVEVKLDAFPNQVFKGAVSRIDFEAGTTSSGGTAYSTMITFPEGVENFRLGMNGDAQILEAAVNEALLTPLTALVEKSGQTYVWRLKDGRAQKVEVKIKRLNDDWAQIAEGAVAEGEQVIVSNLSQLKEGQPVKVGK